MPERPEMSGWMGTLEWLDKNEMILYVIAIQIHAQHVTNIIIPQLWTLHAIQLHVLHNINL